MNPKTLISVLMSCLTLCCIQRSLAETIPTMSCPLLSQKQAAEIVLNMFDSKFYENNEVDIYVSNRMYHKGDTVFSGKIEGTLIAEYTSWVGYVDLMHYANWSHPCLYIFVNAKTGRTTTVRKGWCPPDLYQAYTPYLLVDIFKDANVKTTNDAFHKACSIYKTKQKINIWITDSLYYYYHDQIDLLNGDCVRIPTPYTLRKWIVFVDLHPSKPWPHDCEYLIVDAFDTCVIRVKKDMPPLHLLDDFVLMRGKNVGSITKVLPLKRQNINSPYRILTLDESEAETPSNPSNDKWAVIISGGKDTIDNHVRYWNNCSAMYKTLLNKGFLASHIFVAISDGLNDGRDRVRSYFPAVYDNSPHDLNEDNIADVRYPATINGINSLFNDVKDSLTHRDGGELFVFTTDHGERRDDGTIVLNLWNNEQITDYDFVDLIAEVNASRVNILMAQCHSGGFIDDIVNSDMDSVVITTACAAEQKSSTMGSNEYDAFVYWWLTAINGISPDGNETGDADYNEDGYISMQEAYYFACTHDAKPESPQIYSNDECLKYSQTMTDLLDECTGPIVIEGQPDIYIKDNAGDFGEEPNISTNKCWISTDIWFENMFGRVTYLLQQGETYRVCARIHNRGDQPSDGTALLYFNWTRSVIGASWPYSWFDNYIYEYGNTYVPRGGWINSSGTIIPSIPAGESFVVSCNWTVPIIDFSPFSSFVEDVDELWQYSVMARICENQTLPGDNMAEQPLSTFVLGSNKVATKQCATISGLCLSHAELPATITGLTAENLDGGIYHLYCDIISSSIESGCLFITLTPDMYYDWGIQGTGFTDLYENGRLTITSNHAELTYFDIAGNTICPIIIEIDTTCFPSGEFIFDLYLVNSDNDSIVGGQRFIYRQGTIIPMSEAPGRVQQPCPPEQTISEAFRVTCSPNPTENSILVQTNEAPYNAIYYITDIQGQRLISSEQPQIDVSHLPNGIYWVTVESEFGVSQTKFIKQ